MSPANAYPMKKCTQEDITAERDKAARLKADVLQRLAAIDEKLTASSMQSGFIETDSQNVGWSPPSPLSENGVTSCSVKL